jgi:type IV pilus assembly protein PilC
MNTMLNSGIPMIKALDLTKSVVENHVYIKAIEIVTEDVKGGASVSESFAKHPEFPNILIQMIKVGEETGNLGKILATLATFYQREVKTAVDTLVDLIEPIMIVLLGLGVGTLLASVLIPIYNISSSF